MQNLKEQKKNAQAILNARALYPDSSLTDLYDELTKFSFPTLQYPYKFYRFHRNLYLAKFNKLKLVCLI